MSVRKYLNPEAARTNTIVGHTSKSGCCEGDIEFCKYSYEGAITNVTGFTLKVGEDLIAVTFPSVSTPRDIRKAIQDALDANGYDPFYEDDWRGVRVSATEICVVGEAEITEFQIDGEPQEAEKRCNTGAVCEWTGEADFSTTFDLSTGGASSETITVPAGGAANTFQTNLEDGLGNLNVEFKSVVVTEDAGAGTYKYTISVYGSVELYADGVSLTFCKCYPDFVPNEESE